MMDAMPLFSGDEGVGELFGTKATSFYLKKKCVCDMGVCI